jgi:hypothetical protein
MSEPTYNPCGELEQAAAELHRLVIVCRSTGLRKQTPECRDLLLKLKQLSDDTSKMLAIAPTGCEVEAMTVRFRALAPLLLDVMKTGLSQQ